MKANKNFTYLRQATKAKDGMKGVVYRHRWNTGVQDLVFASHANAKKWFEAQEKNKDKAV